MNPITIDRRRQIEISPPAANSHLTFLFPFCSMRRRMESLLWTPCDSQPSAKPAIHAHAENFITIHDGVMKALKMMIVRNGHIREQPDGACRTIQSETPRGSNGHTVF